MTRPNRKKPPRNVALPTIVFGAKCRGKITMMSARVLDAEIEWMMTYNDKHYGSRLPYDPADPNDFVNGMLRCLEHAGQTVAVLDAQAEKDAAGEVVQ